MSVQFPVDSQPALNPGFETIQRSFDPKHERWTAKILPGEYYVGLDGEAITTVLGSCIAACVRDREVEIGGMNHFMLPEDLSEGRSNWLDKATGLSTRYGSFAMESLINELLKRGARRGRLEVKLFGGGRMLASMTDVGARNIEFARHWLAMEGLRIAAQDVGQDVPRRIIYFPDTGRVLVKHLRTMENRVIASREQDYLQAFRQRAAADGSQIEIFS